MTAPRRNQRRNPYTGVHAKSATVAPVAHLLSRFFAQHAPACEQAQHPGSHLPLHLRYRFRIDHRRAELDPLALRLDQTIDYAAM